MEYKELIECFAKKHGIGNYTIENGEVTLVVDYTAVTIREAKNARAVIISAMIGGPLPDSKGRLASFMLQANHLFSGADAVTICQNPDTDEYLVVRALPHALATLESLSETIETLVNVVEEYRGTLTTFMDVDREASQDEEDLYRMTPMFGGFFIQV